MHRLAPWLLALGCSAAGDDGDGTSETGSTGVDASTSAAASTSHDSSSGADGSSSGADDGGSSADDGGSTGDGPAPEGPTRYPHDVVHSPLTPAVAQRLSAIRARGPELADDVFMKAGASSDVNLANLHCFATGPVELGRHGALADALAVFLAGEAAGTTPFDRDSLATEVGRTAQWAIDGEPSPLVAELDAIAPGLAFVHFGTNDMELGLDPGTALPGFFAAMSSLLDQLEQRGVVPLLVGLTRRGDDADADRWIATYNAVLRALAQQRQLPFVDAWLAIDPLPGHGLGPDGLHLEAYAGGACVFTEVGLTHGYNVRNLIQLQALARTDAVLTGADAPDVEPLPPLLGTGDADAPWQIDALPFVHDGDTHDGGDEVDLYDCSSSDQSGPERTYALDLAVESPLRVIVLDREGVDVDVHVLAGAGPRSCIARDDTVVTTSLGAGTWRIVVDTWSDGATDFPGAYVLAVVPCDAADPACVG